MILSIDPGLDGAIARLTDDGDLLDVVDMPTLEVRRGKSAKRHVDAVSLGGVVRTWLAVADEPVRAVVEKVGAMPGQGVTSVFSFGRSFGVIEGALGALLVPTAYVAPVVWPKALGVTPGKDGRRDLAIRTWPTKAGLFARKKDDGRADAALIGLWYARQLKAVAA